MPLLNSTIMRLNEITTLVEDKTNLTSENESLIKQIFKEINEKGNDMMQMKLSPGLKMKVVGMLKM